MPAQGPVTARLGAQRPRWRMGSEGRDTTGDAMKKAILLLLPVFVVLPACDEAAPNDPAEFRCMPGEGELPGVLPPAEDEEATDYQQQSLGGDHAKDEENESLIDGSQGGIEYAVAVERGPNGDTEVHTFVAIGAGAHAMLTTKVEGFVMAMNDAPKYEVLSQSIDPAGEDAAVATVTLGLAYPGDDDASADAELVAIIDDKRRIMMSLKGVGATTDASDMLEAMQSQLAASQKLELLQSSVVEVAEGHAVVDFEVELDTDSD